MDPLLTDIDPSVAEGDEEQSGAYYRCRDDIEHFRLKVRVSHISQGIQILESPENPRFYNNQHFHQFCWLFPQF